MEISCLTYWDYVQLDLGYFPVVTVNNETPRWMSGRLGPRFQVERLHSGTHTVIYRKRIWLGVNVGTEFSTDLLEQDPARPFQSIRPWVLGPRIPLSCLRLSPLFSQLSSKNDTRPTKSLRVSNLLVLSPCWPTPHSHSNKVKKDLFVLVSLLQCNIPPL